MNSMHDHALDLGGFQHAFARALLMPELDPVALPPAIARLAAQPGFAVYRNTLMKGCVDALRANYPAVARLVGGEWFDAAAAVYVGAHPPRTPVLVEYGDSFPDFLAMFTPAAELGYLAEVARLDRFWTEAHVAADARPLDPAAISGLDAGALGAMRLRPHPATRWAWFDRQPIRTLWQRNRDVRGTGDCTDVHWLSEAVLIVRPYAEVTGLAIERADCAFLDACAAGHPLVAAAEAALAVDPAANLAELLARLLDARAFASPAPNAINEETP